jgi:hypothetical protein
MIGPAREIPLKVPGESVILKGLRGSGTVFKNTSFFGFSAVDPWGVHTYNARPRFGAQQ